MKEIRNIEEIFIYLELSQSIELLESYRMVKPKSRYIISNLVGTVDHLQNQIIERIVYDCILQI